MRLLVPVVAVLSYIKVPKVEGALTISKVVYGPLGGSTTLQCKDTTAVSGAVTWYFNTVTLITVDGIKYSEVGIPGGFGYNLTISNLQPSDEGNYRCEIGIDAAIAIYLPIEYRPGDSDINIDDNGNIIIKSYPSPTFTVVAKNQSGLQTLNGTQSTQDNVTDNTKTTKWTLVTSLSADLYTFIVTVSAPGNIIKEKNITIYDTTRASSPTPTAETATTITTTLATHMTIKAMAETEEVKENLPLVVIIPVSVGGGFGLTFITIISIVLYRRRKNKKAARKMEMITQGGNSDTKGGAETPPQEHELASTGAESQRHMKL